MARFLQHFLPLKIGTDPQINDPNFPTFWYLSVGMPDIHTDLYQTWCLTDKKLLINISQSVLYEFRRMNCLYELLKRGFLAFKNGQKHEGHRINGAYFLFKCVNVQYVGCMFDLFHLFYEICRLYWILTLTSSFKMCFWGQQSGNQWMQSCQTSS